MKNHLQLSSNACEIIFTVNDDFASVHFLRLCKSIMSLKGKVSQYQLLHQGFLSPFEISKLKDKALKTFCGLIAHLDTKLKYFYIFAPVADGHRSHDRFRRR